jgi:hypothetical protein
MLFVVVRFHAVAAICGPARNSRKCAAKNAAMTVNFYNFIFLFICHL